MYNYYYVSQINSSSLYGRCYLTGEVVNIEDVSKVERKENFAMVDNLWLRLHLYDLCCFLRTQGLIHPQILSMVREKCCGFKSG